MKISDIFRSATSTDRASNTQKKAEVEGKVGDASAQRLGEPGQDSVQISSRSKQLVKISSIISEEEQKRAERVSQLKEQVESGEFDVSSEDVARAIVNFNRP